MPTEPTTPIRFGRLLLTGAAGTLGRELRARLRAHCDVLRVSDRVALTPAAAGEEVVIAELDDAVAVRNLLEGVDAVVHLGGVSTEQPWAPILAANIVGVYNLYEAARAHGVKRIVFASSNHVTGFRRQDEVIGPRDPMRPDGLYGVSKAFGENLASFYWDRHGVESVCLRIGSATPAPEDRRMLATWLSLDDLERLVLAALRAYAAGFTVIYGMSDNATSWWDNASAKHIGYRPQDRSDDFAAQVLSQPPRWQRDDPAAIYQGGVFVRLGPFD